MRRKYSGFRGKASKAVWIGAAYLDGRESPTTLDGLWVHSF